MDRVAEDCFVVYARAEEHSFDQPGAIEEPLAYCETYEEAHRLHKELEANHRHSVVRFVGTSGGGD